jgi:lipopolysaccharide transport system permease protein
MSENTIIIEVGQSEKNYWKNLWKYKELFYILSWRDVKVRYKQTTIGLLWALLRPFLTMVVFTIIFGNFAGMNSDKTIPYAIVVFAGLLPWQFFSSSFSSASESLILNSNLLTKVYFPRLIVPISAIVTNFVDFLISFFILIILMIYFQFLPSYNIVFLPFFIILTILLSCGLGIYLAVLNVKYRDFRYVTPFIVQMGLYISPVGFSSKVVPEKWQLLYNLNPMVGIIDGFRWCIIGDTSASPFTLNFLISIILTFAILLFSIYKFRKLEKTFADII